MLGPRPPSPRPADRRRPLPVSSLRTREARPRLSADSAMAVPHDCAFIGRHARRPHPSRPAPTRAHSNSTRVTTHVAILVVTGHSSRLFWENERAEMERAREGREGRERREGRDVVAREAWIAATATRQRGIVTAEQRSRKTPVRACRRSADPPARRRAPLANSAESRSGRRPRAAWPLQRVSGSFPARHSSGHEIGRVALGVIFPHILDTTGLWEHERRAGHV